MDEIQYDQSAYLRSEDLPYKRELMSMSFGSSIGALAHFHSQDSITTRQVLIDDGILESITTVDGRGDTWMWWNLTEYGERMFRLVEKDTKNHPKSLFKHASP
jgi:hypothetical protein